MTANEAHKKTLATITNYTKESLSELFEEIEKAINEGEMYIYWRAELTQLQKNYLKNIGYYIANKTGEYDSAKISWEYVVGGGINGVKHIKQICDARKGLANSRREQQAS